MSMTPDQYLKKVLKRETFSDEDPELKDLRQRREDVKALLTAHFAESDPSIRWAGSMAKGTMVRASYDGDVTCYFPHEDEPKKSLEDLYLEVEKALQDDYAVDHKASALRIRDKNPDNFNVYLHIDVVPGRFTDDDQGDVFLHRTTGDKARLKTNLDVHIEHVRESGVREAIRLAKVWNCRHGVGAKTFILELLVVKLLQEKKSAPLSEQLLYLWAEMRDNSANLAVEDPANPSGNDLKPALDECRASLALIATTTLTNIEHVGWDAIFGEVEEDDDGGGAGKSKSAAASAAAAVVSRPTRPWTA
jgi:hypothetical protein